MRCRLGQMLCVAMLLSASLFGAFPEASGRASAGGDLQNAFARVANEFGVPESVLLAVSYDESRWEQHAGQPSVAGGFGLMHLTDVPDNGLIGPPNPSQHTLNQAAELLKVRPDALKTDPVQNLRGGAVLLAAYARDTVDGTPSDPGAWYGAVAKYSGASRADVARGFADTVMTTIRNGASRTTSESETVTLAPRSVTPNRHTADSTYPPGEENVPAECPEPLLCGSTLALPGNFLAADRPRDGLDIKYIVIHDTEGFAFDSIRIFQDAKRGTSANYLIRASDGLVVQIVPTKDIAFHAGNWYFNSHAIGIEHEGFAVQGATWYNEQLYQSSARLVRYLAQKYGVPLDRAHIIGHDNIPGQTPEGQGKMHWDPGPYWDWAHYMQLLGAPLVAGHNPSIVTIAPPFAENYRQVDNFCDPKKPFCPDLPLEPSNFVRLHTAPSFEAPLIADPSLSKLEAVPGFGTRKINDWGDTAATGEKFYRAGSQGDWDAIWFDGQKAWFYNPGHANTLPGDGVAITPKTGRDRVCVYGEAYPDPAENPSARVPSMVPLSCEFAAGQVYIATEEVGADYDNFRSDVRGATRYDQIFYNHRLAYVRADDVQTMPPVR